MVALPAQPFSEEVSRELLEQEECLNKEKQLVERLEDVRI